MLIDPCSLTERLVGEPSEVLDVLVDATDRTVVRVRAPSGDLLVKIDSEPRRIGNEVATIRRLSAEGLPAAPLLAVDPGPPMATVRRWVDGGALSARSTVTARTEVGRTLRAIHDLGGRPPYAGAPTWSLFVAGWLNQVIGWWERSGASRSEVGKAWHWYHALLSALETVGGDLALFDTRPGHLLLDGDRLVAIVDLSDAGPGDGAIDLATIELWEPSVLSDVLAGWDPSGRRAEVARRTIPFYAFLRRLASAEQHERSGQREESRRQLELVTLPER